MEGKAPRNLLGKLLNSGSIDSPTTQFLRLHNTNLTGEGSTCHLKYIDRTGQPGAKTSS